MNENMTFTIALESSHFEFLIKGESFAADLLSIPAEKRAGTLAGIIRQGLVELTSAGANKAAGEDLAAKTQARRNRLDEILSGDYAFGPGGRVSRSNSEQASWLAAKRLWTNSGKNRAGAFEKLHKGTRDGKPWTIFQGGIRENFFDDICDFRAAYGLSLKMDKTIEEVQKLLAQSSKYQTITRPDKRAEIAKEFAEYYSEELAKLESETPIEVEDLNIDDYL